MGLTAIECIERQLSAAVRMFFNGDDPIAIMTFVSINAHSIEKYAKRKKVIIRDRFFYDLTRAMPEFGPEKVGKLLSDFRALLTHPESPLWDDQVDLDAQEPELLLYAVCHDFELLAEAIRRELIAEIRAFILWFYAKHLIVVDGDIPFESKYKILRGIREQSEIEQIRRKKIYELVHYASVE